MGEQPAAGQVLAGMGGVGKTQLAADYARTAWQNGEVDVLVWTTADNATAAASGYAQAGMEVLGAGPSDPQQAARSFLSWLEPKSQERPCRWLVVLDDVTDPTDLKGLWPPTSPHGRTLVTTRRRDDALTESGRQLIEVGLFTEAESLAYLTAKLAARHRHEPAEQLAALAADLGHLPLALSQAAAYLIDSGENAATYQELLADRTTTLADAAPDALPGDQTTTVAAAWSLCIDRADTLRPAGLARPMLQLTAMLDANGIPQDVLTSSPALAYLTAHRTRTGPAPAGEPAPVSVRDARRALRALHRLSLIDHTPNTPGSHDGTVRVHQLIQRAVRDTFAAHHHHQSARTAGDALLAVWPDIERNTALAQALRANAQALAHHADPALYKPDAHPVLYRMGASLGETGQTTAARDHYQDIAETIGQHLGTDHPDALAARHGLIHWQGESGDAADAAAAYEELVEHMVRVLGENHPYTLATWHNLACQWGRTGDVAGAVAVFEELVKHMVLVLGENHPHTSTARHNFAYWRGEMGDSTALEELLADRRRVLGKEDLRTLRAWENFARWGGEAGDPVGAAAAFAELLEDTVRVLGEDHPRTLAARGNLACWRGEAGDPVGAAAAFAELLEDTVRVLGEDHPLTRTARRTLAHWKEKDGACSPGSNGHT
ncbi:tetratricopeptide repeat protein [Streptomyces sp. NPDC127066]|uniref:tetratricopeptide repeat protein n=1 Tax=Streptomyces sp. NPDC127066 TaxID=3347125 RepID=UPI00365BF4F3